MNPPPKAPSQLTRKSHYVPRSYLKRWARHEGRLAVYRLLVGHSRVTEWRWSTPAGIGYHEHIYTSGPASGLSDEIEQWLGREYEDPAGPTIDKACAGASLSSDDWAVLIRFAACQDIRTPSRLLAFLKRQHIQMPALIEAALADAKAAAEEAHAAGRRLEAPAPSDRPAFRVPANLSVMEGPDEGSARLEYRIVVGREMWLWSLRTLLDSTAKVLHQHRWTILRTPVDLSWLTSDNPVIRLAYSSPDEYHFDGGWGRKGCEILLPLDPEHMLYTKVGEPRPPLRDTRCEVHMADSIQRFIVENAHRAVLAVAPNSNVALVRPRAVDAVQYRHEIEEWGRWHEDQLEAERNLLRG